MTKQNRTWKQATAVTLVVGMLSLTAVSSGWAASDQNAESTGAQGGLGVASFMLSIPYGVAKTVYAGLGGLVGGAAYLVTGLDERTAKKIWDVSVLGNYVVTPEHLKGNEPLRFFGVPAAEQSMTDSDAPK